MSRQQRYRYANINRPALRQVDLAGLHLMAPSPFVAAQQNLGLCMLVDGGGDGKRYIAERSRAGWRIIVSAWLVAIVLVVLFTGMGALASRHNAAPHQEALTGAVIPRHDPGVVGPDEMAASDWEERAKAEAYSGW